MKKVKICPKCGQPMLFSFALSHKEYVCVPCAYGEEFFNDLDSKLITDKEYDNLSKKYRKDLQKIGLQTAKNGGGRCKFCGDKFDCESCTQIEKYELKFWGINNDTL